MKAERVDPKTLLADECNVRSHGARSIRAIKTSLARFGQQKPIIIDQHGVIVAGHGLAQAAAELGMPSVLVVRSDLEGAQRTAFAIADNRTADLARWNQEALAAQLKDLQATDAELAAACGFTDAELVAMMNGDAVHPDKGRDFDESIADEVEFHECGECGCRWPK